MAAILLFRTLFLVAQMKGLILVNGDEYRSINLDQFVYSFFPFVIDEQMLCRHAKNIVGTTTAHIQIAIPTDPVLVIDVF